MAFDYVFSISDIIVGQYNTTINMIAPNAISTAGANSYVNVRNFMLNALFFFVAPFLVLLTFASSFINNNQTIIGYLINSIAVLMATPIVIYAFSEILTNLLNVSILNANYIPQVFFTNFLLICVVNLLMALSSFIFVRQGAIESA